MIVTHADMRAVGYCNRGGRDFFASHGLDWADFVRNGIDSDVLRALNDAMADKVIEQAEKNAQ